jgi:hypothetical protein
MKSKTKTSDLLRAFAIELVVYAVLVTIYFFVALHFLGGWLKEVFDSHRTLYAFAAFALIVGQGILLEFVTSWLLRLFGKKIR